MAKRLVKISNKYEIILDKNVVSCANCVWKRPWINKCIFFRKKLEAVGQRNGGFHHLRCQDCIQSEQENDPLCGDINKQEQRYILEFKKQNKDFNLISKEISCL